MTDTPSTGSSPAPLRMLLVGAGSMGRNWLRVLSSSTDVRLVGLVDLDVDLARRAARDAGLEAVVVGPSLSDVAARSGAEAVVNVTVPAAHHPVTSEALFLGLPVLSEKPVAPTLSQALSLAATAEVAGPLLMTSQSRRYYRTLAAFRNQIASIGTLGIVTTEFFKAPRFGGFRDEMAHPLLVDMAIHPFDVVRYLLDASPISVRCEAFHPPWSWYRGAAAAHAAFEFENGVRYLYTGSWCSPGLETSWNGTWRASGSDGSAVWDGENAPRVEIPGTPRADVVGEPPAGPEEIAGALAEFVHSLRTGSTPSGEVHSNVMSLAMVEAAVRSADTGERVVLADLLEGAYQDALAGETRAGVRDRLAAWGSAASGLARP
ncbi:MAG: hypothetical protein QOE37_780 [Microbacteriaceae bacterium]|nr:hypothetical protein [Microbacteriaceae bacterium]